VSASVIKASGYIVGAALIFGAVLNYGRVVAWQASHNPQPLTLPISLVPGTVETPQIKIDSTADYDIVIELDGPHQPTNFDIAWQILDSGVVARGTSEGGSLDNWAGIVERTIGKFRGQAGHSYSLILQIGPNQSRLEAANPVLKVQIPRGLWEDYGAGPATRKWESVALGALGFLILGGFWLWGAHASTR
jgi:hypothetical protein